MIKTKSNLSDKLQTFIKDNHSYDLPEIIFIPILSGDSNYLTWIHQTTN
jgi:periplasmic divalent cation tolerance protein